MRYIDCESIRATSRKTRIETYVILIIHSIMKVLEPLPEKQGLKPYYIDNIKRRYNKVLEPLPEKQGLKRHED